VGGGAAARDQAWLNEASDPIHGGGTSVRAGSGAGLSPEGCRGSDGSVEALTYRGMTQLVALLIALGLLAACNRAAGLPGAPDGLADLLQRMPATAADRGLYFSDLRASGPDDGFGTVLPFPSAGTSSLGFGLDDVTYVLESGGPPATVLAGAIDVRSVAAAAEAAGYTVARGGGWTVFTRNTATPGDPLAAAVPSGAVRRGVVVLGDRPEVEAVVAGAETAADGGTWSRLAAAAGQDVIAAAMAPPPDVSAAARRMGVPEDAVLRRAGVDVTLRSYEGFLLAYGGEDDGDRPGVIALLFPPGGGGSDEAAAMARRLVLATVIDDPTRRFADHLEPGPPRWLEAARVVRMPVRWQVFDPDLIRADVELQRLAFLAPGGGEAPES
jgi:hypothetical protein